MSNKTSDENVANIEDDVKEIKESIEEAYRCYDYDLDYNPFSRGIAEMIERILAEREQDKARIKDLEEELEKANRQLDLDYVEENFTTKQKVKEGLEKIEDYFDRLNGPDEDIEYIRQVKNELLGGEK